MTKHGASHGAAVLVSIIASSLLVDIVRKHIPKVSAFLDTASQQLSDFIFQNFGRQFSPSDISTVSLAIILAVIWGVAFSWIHKD